jgi:tricorn protease
VPLNENSASDGDIFPWMFREAGLGPLIGKRSWGGVVGISGHGPLIDGGEVSVPEFGHASAQGQWSVEGIGVVPDIEVENDPASIIAGRDPQLERGVKELLDRLATRSFRSACAPTRSHQDALTMRGLQTGPR